MDFHTMTIKRFLYITLILGASLSYGHAQSNTKTMKDSKTQTNPLLCDPEDAACELPGEGKVDAEKINQQNESKVTIVYFTDPICSSCWAIEAQLRKLKLEYGDYYDIEYRMGGLLPDWSYNSGGISKPSDVARHWDEVSPYYDMPIVGDIWLEDPLDSSYPPSIAYKAAQMQSESKSDLFLREIREMVFLEKKNITKWEHLSEAAKKSGLELTQFKTDYEGRAKNAFQDDLKMARLSGVRGFPTLIMMNDQGQNRIVYGAKPYAEFEKALKTLDPNAKARAYDTNPDYLFNKYNSLTAREYSVLSSTPRKESENALNAMLEAGKLTRLETKNGSIWRRK